MEHVSNTLWAHREHYLAVQNCAFENGVVCESASPAQSSFYHLRLTGRPELITEVVKRCGKEVIKDAPDGGKPVFAGVPFFAELDPPQETAEVADSAPESKAKPEPKAKAKSKSKWR